MPGSTIATKNAALCSMDVHSTTGWDSIRYGGEGGSRTHEPGFARLPAFEAGSFDHSDTSPRWLSHSNGGATAGQRRSGERFNAANAELLHSDRRGISLARFACCLSRCEMAGMPGLAFDSQYTQGQIGRRVRVLQGE